MSAIAPNSTVKVLKGIPFDKSYNHTARFATLNDQIQTISSFVKYTFSNLTYQRVSKGKIRVQAITDNLYDCNYLMFQNTNYGNKWFFAFIDEVEYINDNTTEISYTIDVIQTWWFDFNVMPCYVEREHTESDEIGENVIPEGINGGEKVVAQMWRYRYPRPDSTHHTKFTVIILAIPNANTEHHPLLEGEFINGVYTPTQVLTFDVTDYEHTAETINTAIYDLILNQFTIVNIYQVPSEIWYTAGRTGMSSEYVTYNRTAEFPYILRKGSQGEITGYTPKNNKLYTSPYRDLVVTNNDGKSVTYNWELFSNKSQARFKIEGVAVPSCEIAIAPQNYRLNVGQTDDDNQLTISNLPNCAWSEDSFATWWATNKQQYVNGIVSQSLSAIASGANSTIGALTTINPMKMLKNVGTGIVNFADDAQKIAFESLSVYQTNKDTPDVYKGQSPTSYLNVAQNRIGFNIYDMGIDGDFAKTVDDYFTMYGYAIKQIKQPNVKKPNPSLRPYWNYIKTVDCAVEPKKVSGNGMNAKDVETIMEIFDKGITFWNKDSTGYTLDNFGDYSKDNSPVT